MTKTAFALCMALLCTIPLAAQPTFKVSEPYERINTRVKDYFEVDNNIYSIKFRREGAYIQGFGSEAHGEEQNELLPLPEGYNFETILEIKDEHYVVYSVYDRKAIKHALLYRKLDFRKNDWSGEEKIFLEINGEAYGYRETADLTEHKTKFKIIPSANEEYNLIYYTIMGDDNSTNGYFVFDKNFDETFHQQKTQEDFGEEWSVHSRCVTNDGKAISLLTKPDRTNEPKIRWVPGDPLPKLYKVITLTADSEEMESSVPNFTHPALSNLSLYETPQHGPAIFACYHPSIDKPFEGFFIQPLNGNKVIEYKASQRELSRQEIKYYRNEDRKKVIFKPEDLDNLVVTEIKHMDDGSQFIIMERDYVSYTKGGTGSAVYHKDQILAIKADYDGNIKWMRYLPKYQVGRRIPGSMSYSYTYDQNKHYVMYMEHPENAEVWDNKSLRAYGEGNAGALVAITIDDKTGQLTKKVILDSDNIDKKRLYHLWPIKVLHVSDDEFAVEGYKKKVGDVMLKISLGS